MVEARIWAGVRIELSRQLNRVVPLIDRFCHRLPPRQTAFPPARSSLLITDLITHLSPLSRFRAHDEERNFRTNFKTLFPRVYDNRQGGR